MEISRFIVHLAVMPNTLSLEAIRRVVRELLVLSKLEERHLRVYNRDVPNAEKVSLHASGDQHIAISDQTAVRVIAVTRFGPRWTEPVFDFGVVPTFSILFPPWGSRTGIRKTSPGRKANC